MPKPPAFEWLNPSEALFPGGRVVSIKALAQAAQNLLKSVQLKMMDLPKPPLQKWETLFERENLMDLTPGFCPFFLEETKFLKLIYENETFYCIIFFHLIFQYDKPIE